jgi:hypothetical protein
MSAKHLTYLSFPLIIFFPAHTPLILAGPAFKYCFMFPSGLARLLLKVSCHVTDKANMFFPGILLMGRH